MIGKHIAFVDPDPHRQIGRIIPLWQERNKRIQDDYKRNLPTVLVGKVNMVDFHLVALSELLSKQLFLLDELLACLPDLNGKAQLAVLVESTREQLREVDRTLNDQREMASFL